MRFNCNAHHSYYAEFLPGLSSDTRPHAEPGVEFMYLLAGTLVVQIEEAEHMLEAGDALYFDSAAPHSYRRSGARACRAVVVTAG